MAAVELTITGLLYDKLNRTTQQVVLIGEASLTGLGVGGGPIIGGPGQPGQPPGIWGGGNVPMPTPPIANVPGLPPTQNPPGFGNHPSHPIVNPPPGGPPIEGPPPDVEIPPPGSPPVILPGSTPTHPITPPPAIVVDYPGVGRVLVPQPVS